MCGIAGFISIRPIDNPRSILQRMCDAIRHRGPDDEGFFYNESVGLGMRRLSVIDLDGGHQPMFDEDGSVAVVFNGEIYNFVQLREELIAKGRRFKTRSDTEVIVHLYAEEGERFVERLRGMFAIALWDDRKKILLLARDRMGVKPLYVAQRGPELWFASEIKSLLAAGTAGREPDLHAMRDYLSLGYIPAPRSAFRDIRKVPPATVLIWNSGGVVQRRYWKSDYRPAERFRDEEEAVEALHEAVLDAVKSHLVSDVPLGVFLSGGLDSSLIVSLMREAGARDIKTFSIGFEEESYNELPYARQAARRFETDAHEYLITSADWPGVDRMLDALDEPFADSSALPMYFLARLARKSVVVALSGEGGDELFAGYHTYAATLLSMRYMRLPPFVRRAVAAGVQAVPASMRKVSLDYMAKRFVSGASHDYMESHVNWKRHFTDLEIAGLFPELAASALESGPSWRTWTPNKEYDPLANLLDFDSSIYLPDDLLVKNDRMTMAHSLEARVPFCDHLLAEFVQRLPSRYKMKGRNKKRLLKKLAQKRLGPAFTRRRKAGFNAPLPVWIKSGRFDAWLEPILNPDRTGGTCWLKPDISIVKRMVNDHQAGRRDFSRQIWTLLALDRWRKNYLS